MPETENNFVDWYAENAETYPTPIARWDSWWAAKCRQAIDGDETALGHVEAYAKAGWILKSRPDELRAIVAKSKRHSR